MTFEQWTAALEAAQAENTSWRVEINSPVYARWDGKRGYTDRWGRFIAVSDATEAA